MPHVLGILLSLCSTQCPAPLPMDAVQLTLTPARLQACLPAPAVDAAVMRRAELTGALVAGTPRRAAVAACCRIVRAWPQFNALTGCSVIVNFGRCCIAVLASIDAHSNERPGHAQL